MGEELSDSDIDMIMGLADGDGDGTIDVEEFIQMGKMNNEVKANHLAVMAGLDALGVRLDGEVSELSSSIQGAVTDLGAKVDGEISTSIRTFGHAWTARLPN